ncbi:hypothetical protein PR048_000723 [Dryococelus australis]|uniref:Uncharacterized protein n=1 Tax=Dryococelus australis TaxID=614101 RepID=A0ABQ9IFF7_9NEOP|nr:hypothetical protein PR048_000723 [Dryococelus australis]
MRAIEVSMEQRWNESAGKREIPEKTRRPTASSGTMPTCENPDDVPQFTTQKRRCSSLLVSANPRNMIGFACVELQQILWPRSAISSSLFDGICASIQPIATSLFGASKSGCIKPLPHTACLIIPPHIEPGHEQDCGNHHAKQVAEIPSTRPVIGGEYVKQRAPYRPATHWARLSHQAIAKRRAQRWPIAAGGTTKQSREPRRPVNTTEHQRKLLINARNITVFNCRPAFLALEKQLYAWAAVAERIECVAPRRTGFNSQPGHSLIFASGNRTGRCRCSAGFLGDLPFPPPLHSGDAPLSPRFGLIGSQDLCVLGAAQTQQPLYRELQPHTLANWRHLSSYQNGAFVNQSLVTYLSADSSANREPFRQHAEANQTQGQFLEPLVANQRSGTPTSKGTRLTISSLRTRLLCVQTVEPTRIVLGKKNIRPTQRAAGAGTLGSSLVGCTVTQGFPPIDKPGYGSSRAPTRRSCLKRRPSCRPTTGGRSRKDLEMSPRRLTQHSPPVASSKQLTIERHFRCAAGCKLVAVGRRGARDLLLWKLHECVSDQSRLSGSLALDRHATERDVLPRSGGRTLPHKQCAVCPLARSSWTLEPSRVTTPLPDRHTGTVACLFTLIELHSVDSFPRDTKSTALYWILLRRVVRESGKLNEDGIKRQMISRLSSSNCLPTMYRHISSATSANLDRRKREPLLAALARSDLARRYDTEISAVRCPCQQPPLGGKPLATGNVRHDEHLGSPLVDDRPIMNAVKYRVVSGLVWIGMTMVTSITETNRAGVLAVVEIGDSLSICLKRQ